MVQRSGSRSDRPERCEVVVKRAESGRWKVEGGKCGERVSDGDGAMVMAGDHAPPQLFRATTSPRPPTHCNNDIHPLSHCHIRIQQYCFHSSPPRRPLSVHRSVAPPPASAFRRTPHDALTPDTRHSLVSRIHSRARRPSSLGGAPR